MQSLYHDLLDLKQSDLANLSSFILCYSLLHTLCSMYISTSHTLKSVKFFLVVGLLHMLFLYEKPKSASPLTMNCMFVFTMQIWLYATLSDRRSYRGFKGSELIRENITTKTQTLFEWHWQFACKVISYSMGPPKIIVLGRGYHPEEEGKGTLEGAKDWLRTLMCLDGCCSAT